LFHFYQKFSPCECLVWIVVQNLVKCRQSHFLFGQVLLKLIFCQFLNPHIVNSLLNLLS
jgi:hypothetical protein